MKIYNQCIIREKSIIIDGKEFPAKIGKHEIWASGRKLIHSYSGKITPIRNHKGDLPKILNHTFNLGGWDIRSLESIYSEYTIMREMSKLGMAPRVGDIFWIKNIISKFPYGVYRCDPYGMYGYEVTDANNLPKGKFNPDKFKELFVTSGKVIGNEHALSDMYNKKRENVVNGYCIDIRRSIIDGVDNNFYLADTSGVINICIGHDLPALKEKILKYGQYPFKKRTQNYQDYWMSEWYEPGSRNTLDRFKRMQLPDKMSGSVLDLGCCIGSMLIESHRRGARNCTGIDFQPEYIDCARNLARVNSQQINYMVMDLTKVKEVSAYINQYYSSIDYVFALSLYKHLKQNIIHILKNTPFKVLLFESNNAPQKYNTPMCLEIESNLKDLGKVIRLGMTTDRSPRCLWRVEK